ncbi:MAG: Fe-S cluster assembly protein SufD [Chloroflexota bacterium]|nr:Fe-S cluster assembly protein SufD [Chloroflexota bacterium]
MTATHSDSPTWLAEYRALAQHTLNEKSLPDSSDRPWKYTDITTLDIFSLKPLKPEDRAIRIASCPEDLAVRGLIDSAHDPELEQKIQPNLGHLIPADEDYLLAANSAQWTDGFFINPEQGVRYTKPLSIEIDLSKRSATVFPRILIVAEANSELDLIINSTSIEEEALVIGALELQVKNNARLAITFTNNWGFNTKEFTTLRAELADNASLNISTICIGGAIVKHRYDIHLNGTGADSRVKGIAVGDKTQHFDFMTVQEHNAPKSSSDVEIKTALAGESRAVYYGITRVTEEAKGSQANQENRNMLLAPKAKADSDPVLEILTNDVSRCGHGATVGPVDAEGMFYLMSRGLDKRAALRTLVGGFISPIVDYLKDAELADTVRATVNDKLQNASLD